MKITLTKTPHAGVWWWTNEALALSLCGRGLGALLQKSVREIPDTVSMIVAKSRGRKGYARLRLYRKSLMSTHRASFTAGGKQKRTDVYPDVSRVAYQCLRRGEQRGSLVYDFHVWVKPVKA